VNQLDLPTVSRARGAAAAIIGGRAPLLLSALALATLLPRPAAAHFLLLDPPSWMQQSRLGDPQKQSPCGNEGGTPSGIVTRFRAGETITVRWRETIYHPGHWRIAVAADRAELVDPVVTVDARGNAVSATITDPPVPPVIMDNLFPISGRGSARTLEQQITLPNFACPRCTLQVIQFMEGHAPPQQFYWHCADIELVVDAPDAGTNPDAAAAPDAERVLDAVAAPDATPAAPDAETSAADAGVGAADAEPTADAGEVIPGAQPGSGCSAVGGSVSTMAALVAAAGLLALRRRR
jgi:uncharacterized protein (TIGR03382 family)